MTPEAQRIAIAEACGWTEIERYQIRKEKDAPWFVSGKPPVWWKGPDARPWLPDFLNDLNAMHEAIMSLDRDTLDYSNYCSNLNQIVAIQNLKRESLLIQSCDATAAQRAEAFLRTLNLWKE